MNARVFMVLVFSSVFMGIWNSDQKAMHSAIARNKRLQKPIAVFPVPPVETVRRENLSPLEFSMPEPRPVRVAMRGTDDVGQSEPVIERHEEHSQHQTAAEVPVVTLTPISEDVPKPQNTNVEAESVLAEVSAEAVVLEPATTEEVVSESDTEATTESEDVSPTDSPAEEVMTAEDVSAVTESSESLEPAEAEPADAEPVVTLTEEPAHSDKESSESKSEEVPAEMPVIKAPAAEVAVSETPAVEAVTQIEQDAVPAPEDFSVEAKAEASVAEVVEAETHVATEPVMVAENSPEETVADHSDDVSVENEQPVTESSKAELPELAGPIVDESAVLSGPIAMNEAESNTLDSNAGEAEEEKSLEEKLLKSGEYDMLDVHSEDVTPGTVEPAQDGGATCIPLPRNLASGTWQVIHPSGEFFKITVDRGRSSSVNRGGDDEDILESSFCITAAPDGVRWCFIRSFVDSPAPVRRVTTEFFSPGQQ